MHATVGQNNKVDLKKIGKTYRKKKKRESRNYYRWIMNLY